MDPRYDVLDDAMRHAREFVENLPSRPVGAGADLAELRERFSHPLTDSGEDPRKVIEDLARDADPGLVASAGPRYFGFVIGGSLPVAVAADWLTSAWDQNTGGFAVGPAVSVVEEVAAGWVREVLGLPADRGIGFVTGCQMAHFTCLAARHGVLRDAGCDDPALPPSAVRCGNERGTRRLGQPGALGAALRRRFFEAIRVTWPRRRCRLAQCISCGTACATPPRTLPAELRKLDRTKQHGERTIALPHPG